MRGSKHSRQVVNQSIVHHDLFQPDWSSLVTMKVAFLKHKKKKERKHTLIYFSIYWYQRCHLVITISTRTVSKLTTY